MTLRVNSLMGQELLDSYTDLIISKKGNKEQIQEVIKDLYSKGLESRLEDVACKFLEKNAGKEIQWEDHLTAGEVIKMLNVTRTGLNYLADNGYIKAMPAGGKKMYITKDVVSYIVRSWKAELIHKKWMV